MTDMEEMKQLQGSQQTYRNEVQQQLQSYRDQSIQQQRTLGQFLRAFPNMDIKKPVTLCDRFRVNHGAA